MENQLYEKWLLELQQELEILDYPAIQPLERLREVISLTTKTIDKMRMQVLKDGFASSVDEIYFFKKIKPRLYAAQLYEVLLYNLQNNAPAGPGSLIKEYHEQELLFLFREFRQNAFHYQYFKTGAAELDEQYFLRDAKGGELPVLNVIDAYPGFSAPMDHLFARFIACERLQEYILEVLGELLSGTEGSRNGRDSEKKLTWTGEAINLVELAYGIWLTGQLNNGNASVTEIIGWLETNLHIKIGLAYRRWAAIAARKRISVTKFIDQMKAAVLKRLDEENGR